MDHRKQNRKEKKIGKTQLLPGSPFYQRMRTDEQYLLELDPDKMLQNHYNEAGLGTEIYSFHEPERYGGWEYPASHQRGHFVGHWLSAASRMYALNGNILLKGKIDYTVHMLGECQRENGGKWVFAIPPKYLDWARRGKTVWAPHYNIHKTLMGLLDARLYAGSEEAAQIAVQAAEWFMEYTRELKQEEMDRLLDVETGGMMEVWAELYGLTGKEEHRRLMERYRHRRLEEELRSEEDPLVNRHVNTIIPEIHGYCRAYEATGEEAYLRVAAGYWRQAVEERESFITGAGNLAEAWVGKKDLSGRLGHCTSEQCVGYNMTRLADYLYRAYGEKKYADYIETLLYNSTLAQCFWEGYRTPCGIQTEGGKTQTGVCYYMPLIQGGKKPWGTKFNSFWCCYGTGIQACASFQDYIYEANEEEITVNQYIPSAYREEERRIVLEQRNDTRRESNPNCFDFIIRLSGGGFRLRLRIPDWLDGRPEFLLDGKAVVPREEGGYAVFEETWTDRCLEVKLFPKLAAVALPGSRELYGFKNGPIVLAALSEKAQTLEGKGKNPAEILKRNSEYGFSGWQSSFCARTVGGELLEFVPLSDISFETYTVYHRFV